MMRLNQRGALQIIIVLLLIGGIAATVFLAQKTQIFRPKATLATNISFVDDSGNTITTTTSATVKLKVTSPEWFQPTASPTPSTTPSGKVSPCGNYGDVNSDMVVTLADADMVREAVNGRINFTSEQKIRGDLDGNGEITSVDALYIRRYVSGADKTFKVCPTPTPKSKPTKEPKPTKKPRVKGESTGVITMSVILAEDPNFTSNVKTVNFTTDPIAYTFSTSNTGPKTLYAKFVASDGREQNANPFPVTITLVVNSSPSPKPCTTCDADIDNNGTVDIVDNSRFLACNGKNATDTDSSGRSCVDSDINGDGKVDSSDYSCLTSQFGKLCTQTPTPTPTSTSTSTPTPTPVPTSTSSPTTGPSSVGISLNPYPLKMTSYRGGISINPATVTCIINSCNISLYSSNDLPGSGSTFIFGDGLMTRGQTRSLGIKTPFADPGVYNTQVTFVNNDIGQRVTIPFEVTVLQ